MKYPGLSEYPNSKPRCPEYGEDDKHNHPDIFFLHDPSFGFLRTSCSFKASVLTQDPTEMVKSGFKWFDRIQDRGGRRGSTGGIYVDILRIEPCRPTKILGTRGVFKSTFKLL